jgi:hypothetical protein
LLKVDIHKGFVKIIYDQVHYDLEINNTGTVLIGIERKEVIKNLQEDFAPNMKNMVS